VRNAVTPSLHNRATTVEGATAVPERRGGLLAIGGKWRGQTNLTERRQRPGARRRASWLRRSILHIR